MAKKKKQTMLGTVITVVVVAAVVWMKVQEAREDKKDEVRDPGVEINQPEVAGGGEVRAEVEGFLSVANYSGTSYQVYRDCKLIDSRRNDGDSFFVRAGRDEIEVRFVFCGCS